MTATRELDGSAAGGQFLRTALALAALRNEPVRIENVRGNRSTPGLRHQHLAVLETMAQLCDAAVSGAELGAETVAFDPGRRTIEGGDYAVDIGTAGSITLLFDAVMPLATVLESPLSLTVTGGTDVKWSPPIDYARHVKLPLLRRFGLVAACEVDRRGFYPDGGGRATLHLAPSRIEPIDLAERGPLESVRLYSTAAAALSDRNVATRQAGGAIERLALEDRSLETVERRKTTVATPSPGSAIAIRVDHGTGIAGFTALGERGTPAERVGETAADAANRFLERAAPIDRHMADQLLAFLALAGGRIRIPEPTEHVETSCELLAAFDIGIECDRDDGAAFLSANVGDGLQNAGREPRSGSTNADRGS
ncbi:RNA 3'-terminal phosphate cyclase [Halopiger djelfimassiliensis]|uniref:RNA 3'-terminal phosphate cyclase n=1 Tax=Halopiger djelfimassiliensis TaxID=1293047 RepID=UPI000678106A|nr:RNA 3'-terminal phosphate cyclase [Halopiger djelfimassiliensis]